METEKRLRTAIIFRTVARYTLLVFGILIFLFALVSGSEDYGGGLRGILENSPNALPWLVLLLLVLVAWRWELTGGILITLLGLFLIYFFNILGNNFFVSTFILTLLVTILGSFFIVSWGLGLKKE